MSDKSAMSVPEIFRAAAARVRVRWDRVRFAHCVLGALSHVQGHPCDIWHVYGENKALATVLVKALGLPSCPLWDLDTVWGWNDAPGQTAENVAAGLEFAALVYEEEAAQRARQTPLDPVEA